VPPIARWRRVAWIWGPALVLAAAIFIQSSRASAALPGRSDLAAHFAVFGVLAALVLRGCANGRWREVSWRTGAIAWLLTTAYAASDELHQAFVPGRTAAIDDWAADALGAGLAVAALVIAARARRAGDLAGREV
jgi:VanZ family protein